MLLYYIVGGLITGIASVATPYFAKKKKEIQYLLIMLQMIGYGVVGYAVKEDWMKGLMGCLFVSMVILLSMIDYQELILPTPIIYTGSVLILLLKIIEAVILREKTYLIQSILGGLFGYFVLAILFYTSLWLLNKEGVGYGDVRYCGLLGLFLSPEKVYWMLFLASLIGTCWGFYLLVKNKKNEYFAFGPSLSIGASIVLVWGDYLL
jgi:leader peptidase (prepilin peptidase)/N-methyltransferase